MNDIKTMELYDKLFSFVDANDEVGARKFIIDNLKSFPEDVQKEIVGVFMTEALIKKSDEINTINDAQKEGLNMLAKLQQMKSTLEDKLKAMDITDGLKK